jgi:catecholate siderophore receptor
MFSRSRHALRLGARAALVFALVGAAVGAVVGPARLEASPQQTPPAEPTYTFDLSGGSLADALAQFGRVTGWTITYDAAALADERTAWPVRGSLTARDALARLLQDTGASFTVTGEKTAIVKPLVFAIAGVDVTAEARSGYRAGSSRTLTKTDTPVRDVPQALSVVTRDAIVDQRMASLADVVRYVPGVTMGQGEGNRDQPTIRGNSGNGDLFVDGVRDDVEYLRDLYNVERVEIPKGPNAMIFGRAGGGGLINRVTRQASWSPVLEVLFQGGQYDNRRTEIDLGGGLSRKAAGRVMAMYENSDSYRQGFNVERQGVTATGTVLLGERGAVRTTLERFDDHRTADRGVPSFGGAPVSTDPSTFFGDPSVSYSDAGVNAANATLELRATGSVLVRSHVRFADYKKIYQNVFPGAVNAAGTQVAISAYNNRIWRKNIFNQTDVTGRLRTGAVSHTWLLGTEVGRQASDAFRNTGYFNNTATTVNVPVDAPTTTGTSVTFRQSATDADAHTTAVAWSLYAQDQVELSRHVQGVAGLRVDNFDLDYHNNRSGADLSRSDRVVSPRLGLVLKPIEPLSIYGSYSVSFLPSSGAQFTSLTVTTQTLEPEQFTNYEVGAKWDPRRDLSLTAGAYQLDRTNTSAPDRADPTHTVQTGSQRSRGIELSAAGRITPRWDVLVGYNFQKVEITSRTNAAQPGEEAALTPHHSVSVWNKVQLTPALGVGLGVLHQGEMFAGIDNVVTLPSFTRADAALFVRVTDRVQAQLNVENVFDEKYFSTAHSNNNITPGSPRQVVASLRLRP